MKDFETDNAIFNVSRETGRKFSDWCRNNGRVMKYMLTEIVKDFLKQQKENVVKEDSLQD